MARRKTKLSKPDEILFGETTREDLDELIYGMLSVRIHNNMTIPPCFRNGMDGGIYSKGFSDYEARKFGFAVEDELDGYNVEE